MGHIFHQPPLPLLHWQGSLWQGKITLSAWAEFQERSGSYESRTPEAISEGRVELSIGISGAQPVPPAREQIAAFEHLIATQIPLRDAMLRAILRAYPDWQEDSGYDALERRELMPDIRIADDLRTLMSPSIVHILTTTCEGLAYVGFEFGCTWDEEHGLGILTHGGRVVEVGQADTSFLEWIAERDCRPRS